MRYYMFSVRDRSADAFGVPHFQVSRGAAIRGFTDEVNRSDAQNILFRHPEDFDLYELGSFDDAGADFEVYGKPVQVSIGKDVAVRASLFDADERNKRTSSASLDGSSSDRSYGGTA